MKMLSESQLQQQLKRLNIDTENPWQIRNEKLVKSIRFQDFQQAFQFMTTMADYAENANHHPEWLNVYNRLDISLTTHDAAGITEQDIGFALEVERILARQ